jgi:hypothetical protein
MLPAMRAHAISRLRLLLSSSARLAPALPNACSRWFHQCLRDDLGHLMTRLERGADICIEQLVLDLGIIPAENWEQILHQRLLDALQMALQERLALPVSAMSCADLAWTSGSATRVVDNSAAMWVSGMDEIEGNSEGDSEDNCNASGWPCAMTEPSLDMLRRYLLHGYAEPALHSLFDGGRMLSWLCLQCRKMPQVVAILLHACAVEPAAGRRLWHVFSAVPGSWHMLATVSRERSLRYRRVTGVPHEVWRRRSSPVNDFSGLPQPYFLSVQAASTSYQRFLGSRFLAWLRAQLPDVSPQRWSDQNVHGTQAVMHSQHNLSGVVRETSKNKMETAIMTNLTTPTSAALASERYQVDNAGLILLWPLLPGLFRRWGLLDQGKFIDACAQEQAIYRLDCWLWESHKPAEWRMALTKVLCGWSMAQALARTDQDEDLPAAVQDLDALLHDLATQTPGLLRCDQNDIRHGFLQRPGILHHENQRWHLWVEADASDVLLRQLPWPVSQVSLPWLDAPIEVTWF